MEETINNSGDTNGILSDMITIDELRSFPGLENLSDKEAIETATSLYQLGQVAFQVFVEEHKLISSKTEKKQEDLK